MHNRFSQTTIGILVINWHGAYIVRHTQGHSSAGVGNAEENI